MTTWGRVRTSRAPLDPAAGLVGLLALGVFAIPGWNGVLSRDLGLFVYGGQEFLRGVPPYTGSFNRVGPLADMLPGVGIGLGRLLGIGDVHAARAWFLLISVACVVITFVLARDLTRSRGAAFVAALALVSFQSFTELAAGGPRDKTAMVLFLLLALVALSRERWLLAGCWAALATLTWQPVLLTLVVAAGATIWSGRRPERLRAAAQLVVGGLAVTACFAAYFALKGSWSDAVDGFLLVNLQDTSQPSPLTHAGYAWDFLWSGYGYSLLLVVVGLASAVLAAAFVDHLPRAATRMLMAGALGALATCLYGMNGAPDAFVVLPFAAIGMGIVATELPSPRWVLPGVAVLLVGLAALQAVGLRDETLVDQERSVAAVLGTAPSGSTLLSIQAPQAMAIAGRVNPTPYQMFSLGFDDYVDSHWPGGLAAYADWVAAEDPTLLVVSSGYHGAWAAELLATDYRRLGAAPTWTWYVSRSVPPDRFQAMRTALRALDLHR